MSTRFSFLTGLVCVIAFGCGGSSDSGTSGGDTGGSGDSITGGDSKGDSSTTTDSNGGDSTNTDTGGGGDTTPPGDGGLTCGSTTCAAGEKCCATPSDGGPSFTCATDCPDGSVPIACTGGNTCGGSTPYCCGSVTLDPSTPPCGFSAGSASCTATCQTDIPLSCSGTHKARLCDKASDCADDTGYKNCCTFSGGGTTGTICASDTMKSFSTGCL